MKEITPDLVINRSQNMEDKEPKNFQKYKKKFCSRNSTFLRLSLESL